MGLDRLLHWAGFPREAHRGSPASGRVTTKMPEADAPSQAKRTPDFGRYLPLPLPPPPPPDFRPLKNAAWLAAVLSLPARVGHRRAPVTAPARLLAALGLAALLLATLASLQAPPLRAQTSTVTLLSSVISNSSIGGAGRVVQSFETGRDASTIFEVDVPIGAILGPSSPAAPLVTINEDDSGLPGAEVGPLENPSPLQAYQVNTFTSQTGIDLQANSTYWLVVSPPGHTTLVAPALYTGTVNCTCAEGWSIADEYHYGSEGHSSVGAYIAYQGGFEFEIRGAVAPPPPLIATDELELLDNPLGDMEHVGHAAHNPVHAQPFMTGSDLGYTLTKIELHVSTFREWTRQTPPPRPPFRSRSS